MKIAGLDIGTTGCKLTVFDKNGKYLGKAYHDYPVKRGAQEHEIDASDILDAVFEVICEMSGKYPDIAGIGVTSFGETFIMADREGMPLHKAMLYTDPRGAEQCRTLEEKLGAKHIAAITGVKPHEMYSIPKIMWMKQNRPDVYAEAEHIFLMEDFVIFSLTGRAKIDYSLAARTMGFDITSLSWSGEIFRAANIKPELMSEPVPTGTAVGKVTAKVSERTGLAKDTVIVAMSHDQVAAAVGSGVFASDLAVDGAGTVECITPVYDGIPPLDVMYRGNYAVVPYVIPGKYVCYAFSYTGGALIQWCIDNLAKKEKELAAGQEISINEFLEKGSESPTGLLVLPHFAGAATPYMDTGSRGAVIGLTTDHTVPDIYRACMEGVVYEMKLNLDFLKDSGIRFEMLHATGGGARSAVWMQMKADVLNIPITALETADAGTVGSAMMTGIAVGCFQDLPDAADHMVEKKKVYYPDAQMHERYMEIYERYRKLYDAVRPLM